MTLYKKKYRIESTRLKDWDYSRDGYYFVTICTQDKKCLFGDVVDCRDAPLGRLKWTRLKMPEHQMRCFKKETSQRDTKWLRANASAGRKGGVPAGRLYIE